jgi:hypothetical protein
MTSAVESAAERYDVRTIVGGGVKLGLLTVVAVVVFALLSRALDGTAEIVVQSLIVLLGGVLASYLPALWVQPRRPDTIAWAALVGLLGALVFTVLDTVLLRPLGIYHWTWDAIGGGSGFWYIPVWWMGSALLAWLGAWVAAAVGNARGGFSIIGTAGPTLSMSLLVFLVLVLVQAAPPTPAVMALAFTIALVLSVPLAMVLTRR